ncbi:MAG: hypothetical protein LC107_13580 [Chitinophagales bacterium]|nr:hypothetical protein [Chitinophagales bacterium]
MRTFFSILASLFIFSGGISAQDAIERSVTMSLGLQNSFFIEIPGADSKLAEKTFYEYVKEYGKMKANKKAKEHFLMATKIPLINGSSPVDLYAKFEDGKGMATTYVWVDLGGAFVKSSDHPQQTESLRQFLYDYFIAVRKKVVADELKAEEKKYDSLEKDLKKLKDKNDGFHKDIEKAKQKIAESESNIEKNLVDQDTKVKEIDAQKEVVDQVKDKLNNLGKRD